MDRRSFLSAGSAAALVPILAAANAKTAAASVFAPAAGSGDATLNAAFDKIFTQTLKDSLGFATSLGLDKGDLAYLRKTFDPKPYDQSLRENLAKDKASPSGKAINASTDTGKIAVFVYKLKGTSQPATIWVKTQIREEDGKWQALSFRSAESELNTDIE